MGAFYRATLKDFLDHSSDGIIGILTQSYAYLHNELQRRQTLAWNKEIDALRSAATKLLKTIPRAANWCLLLEYPIPRRSKRLDAVLLAEEVIFCLEFKTEDSAHALQARRQVEDYALDLRDFHERSRNHPIIPVVIALRAPAEDQLEPQSAPTDHVRAVRRANAENLASTLISVFETEHQKGRAPIDAEAWDNSPYRPIPTIIEAAEALYAGHNVREITHSHAGAVNLTTTSDRLIQIIQQAQKQSEKVICFVTGIPGAGKTLAGLNIVHNPALRSEGRPAGVFLSGNVPLVKVVRAALGRVHKGQMDDTEGERTVSTFIQNVHGFILDAMEKSSLPPAEKIVVFDEAQRAWDADQTQKKRGFDRSEAEMILEIMDRHKDWAALIALVGGGQEIHSGEAGLAEWGKTLQEKFPQWKIVASPKVLEKDASLAGHRLFENGQQSDLDIRKEPSLHLEVNLRSFRAEKLAEWVDAVLAGDAKRAEMLFPDLKEFPIGLTRSLQKGRQWLNLHTRGERRCGLVASSGALRLRAHGVEVSSGFRQGNRDMYVHWFLKEPPDIRSSNQLEIAASEFECQGLELDWVGLCWGGDFTFNSQQGGWIYKTFAGSRWNGVKSEIDRNFLLNKYRVLMTRARQGLVIWVPEGNDLDETRPPKEFEATAEFLSRCGIPWI